MHTPSEFFRIALFLIAPVLCAGASLQDGKRSASAVLARYSPEIVQRLHEKKFVALPGTQDEGLFIGALVIFEQPLSRAFHLLSQTERQSEYLPELKQIDKIERDGSAVIDEHHVRILFIPINYRLRTQFDVDAGRISWRLDPRFDNDLHILEGYWDLYEVDASQTLGRFGTRVLLGAAIPSFLQDAATRWNLPRVVDRMRLWVDSDGTYRP